MSHCNSHTTWLPKAPTMGPLQCAVYWASCSSVQPLQQEYFPGKTGTPPNVPVLSPKKFSYFEQIPNKLKRGVPFKEKIEKIKKCLFKARKSCQNNFFHELQGRAHRALSFWGRKHGVQWWNIHQDSQNLPKPHVLEILDLPDLPGGDQISCTAFHSTHNVPRIPKRYHMWRYNDKKPYIGKM